MLLHSIVENNPPNIKYANKIIILCLRIDKVIEWEIYISLSHQGRKGSGSDNSDLTKKKKADL